MSSCSFNKTIAHLEETIRELHTKLSNSEQKAKQREENLNGTIRTLCDGLHDQNTKSSMLIIALTRVSLIHALHSSEEKIADLEKNLTEAQQKYNTLVQQLQSVLTDSKKKGDSLIKTSGMHQWKHHLKSIR